MIRKRSHIDFVPTDLHLEWKGVGTERVFAALSLWGLAFVKFFPKLPTSGSAADHANYPTA